MFGQSLYKCILNDLHQNSSSKESTASGAKVKSSSSLFVKQGNAPATSTVKKWRLNSSNNKSNLLIASKLDLNLMNEINSKEINASLHGNDLNAKDDLFSKRNSVLFEALDLKNTKPLFANKVSAPQSFSFTQSPAKPAPIAEAASDMNQNLSIRREGLVPNIVKSCCKHINDYGLEVLGIFRIDSSKKRIKEVQFIFIFSKIKNVWNIILRVLHL